MEGSVRSGVSASIFISTGVQKAFSDFLLPTVTLNASRALIIQSNSCLHRALSEDTKT